MAKEEYKPNIAIPPGETLSETLEYISMSQKELALRAGLSQKTINEIIKTKSAITPDTAIKLERVLGIPASFWNNLEKNYQETLARLSTEKAMKKEIELAKKFTCYNELSRWGIVEKTRDWKGKAEQLLTFFGVNSLELISVAEPVAFRKTDKKGVSKECLSAWLRWGEIEASKIELAGFDKSRLRNNIPFFRRLTREKPEIFPKKLIETCADCGVALVVIPHFDKTYVNGATKWLNGHALIQLSIRNKWLDIFWFTFFHELCHILKHGKKDQFVEFEGGNGKDFKEREADEFASNMLIPKRFYSDFVDEGDFYETSIKRFAGAIGISPAIVAGRLAHDGKVHWKSVSSHRHRLKFAEEI